MDYSERFKCSLLPDKDDPRDYTQSSILASYDEKVKIPSRVSFMDRVPKIQNQFNIGACAHFAFARIAAVFDPQILFSPLFTYFFTRDYENAIIDQNGVKTVDLGEDTGSTIRGTLKTANIHGWTLEELWNYTISNFPIEPSEAAKFYASNKLKDKRVVYYRVHTVDEIKFGMAMGYVPLLGIKITDSFYSEETMKTGLILPPEGKDYGLHGVPSLCFDDGLKKGSNVIDNSWGDKVGDKGRFYLPYETFPLITSDAWMIKIITLPKVG